MALNCGYVLRNRFVLAPMTTDSSDLDGNASEAELAYIRRRCATGFGMGITSCAYVDEAGRAWRGIGAAKPAHAASLSAVASAFHAGGGAALLQLYDGGRIADPALLGDVEMRAPSAIPSARPGASTPRALTTDEVSRLVDAFEYAAVLGRGAGFDGVELHGANHYLLHQFLSPRANRRTDRWGGDLEARMRFPLEVAERVRTALGDGLILGYRINPFETEANGFSLEDAAQLCNRLVDVGVDYVHISMDDFRRRSPMREDRDWTTDDGRREARNPISSIADVVAGRCGVVASGGIRTPDDARAALDAGADLVAVARAALIDPDWLGKVRTGADASVRRALPATSAAIEEHLTIPPRMVRYVLSRPGWMPREGAPG